MLNGIPYETPRKMAKTGAELVRYGALPKARAQAMDEFTHEWVETKKAGKPFTELRAKVKAYNRRQELKGEKLISWSAVAKKGVNVMKGESYGYSE